MKKFGEQGGKCVFEELDSKRSSYEKLQRSTRFAVLSREDWIKRRPAVRTLTSGRQRFCS